MMEYSFTDEYNLNNLNMRKMDVIYAVELAYDFAKNKDIISNSQITFFPATNQEEIQAQNLAIQFFPIIKEILYPCSTNN